jgi:polyribonucleotide 5'-hydroxyl-kinase
MTDERISVIKLSKSGGCVDRDPSFMKSVYESQIRSYFFGNALSSTPTSTISSIAASSAHKIALSPHAQQLDFSSISLFQYTTSSGFADSSDKDDGNVYQDDEDDEYDPDFLPGSGGGSGNPEIDHSNNLPSTEPPLKRLGGAPPTTLANTLIAITHAPANAPPSEVRDASIMGFLYVADVDVEKSRMRVLAPIGGRMPARALIWGKKWPGEVVGLVG